MNKKRKLIERLNKTIQGIDNLNRDNFEKHIALMDSINTQKNYSFKFSEDVVENKNKLFKIILETMPYLEYYSLRSVYRYGTILSAVQNPTVIEGDSITFILHAQENAYINDIFLEILEAPEIDEIITYNKAIVKFGTVDELSAGMKSKKVFKEMQVPVYNHFVDEKEFMSVQFEYTVVERNE